MHLKGRIVHGLGVEETIAIEQAVVSAERIALDWNQNGRACHLIAKSPNGSHFKGRYNFRRDASDCECELTLYKSAHESLLYGTWREQQSGLMGTLVIRLPIRHSEIRLPDRAEPHSDLHPPEAEMAGLAAAAPEANSASGTVRVGRQPRAAEASGFASERSAGRSESFERCSRSSAFDHRRAIRRARPGPNRTRAFRSPGFGAVQSGP